MPDLAFSYFFQRQHFACFGSWVLYHTLNIMIQYLLSGFELELYSPHEYHYVFWWVSKQWFVIAMSYSKHGFRLNLWSGQERKDYSKVIKSALLHKN